ncbi:hypothetical protein M5K25_004915 [Dendrobium thyrsiflorum]|uniref:Uncharacterized protein n=1 Tax=Dendrobium thyrsiflorum TaxID=117978 RepID=A0ABD0VGV3_DENTH
MTKESNNIRNKSSIYVILSHSPGPSLEGLLFPEQWRWPRLYPSYWMGSQSTLVVVPPISTIPGLLFDVGFQVEDFCSKSTFEDQLELNDLPSVTASSFLPANPPDLDCMCRQMSNRGVRWGRFRCVCVVSQLQSHSHRLNKIKNYRLLTDFLFYQALKSSVCLMYDSPEISYGTIEDIVLDDSQSYGTIGTRTILPPVENRTALPSAENRSSSGREPLLLFHHSPVKAENPSTDWSLHTRLTRRRLVIRRWFGRTLVSGGGSVVLWRQVVVRWKSGVKQWSGESSVELWHQAVVWRKSGHNLMVWWKSGHNLVVRIQWADSTLRMIKLQMSILWLRSSVESSFTWWSDGSPASHGSSGVSWSFDGGLAELRCQPVVRWYSGIKWWLGGTPASSGGPMKVWWNSDVKRWSGESLGLTWWSGGSLGVTWWFGESPDVT